jgi:hypothetical protein
MREEGAQFIMMARRGPRWSGMLAGLAALAALVGQAADTWHVPGAQVRFTVQLTSQPSVASAGYFVQIPDGGILPKQYAVTTVTASGGTVLKSFVFWPNPQTGAGVLFEPPSTMQDVMIYVSPGKPGAAWTPASGLTPSALLCTRSGSGAKGDAQSLASLGPVGPTVHYQNRPGCGPAPLSVPGDLSGRMGPCAIYMLAHLSVTDPGKTWVAPIEFSEKSEVVIDGKAIVPEKRIAKPGGSGAWMDLSRGLHRLEIFSWSGGPAGGSGMMTLTWKTPNTQAGEMGGNRPGDLPFPGTPMWESRPLRGQEIVLSGQAAVTKSEAQDGRPLARIKMEAIENFWLEDDKPLTEYDLSPEEAGNPPDTLYEWSFGNGAKLIRPRAHWLFPADQEQQISLTASSGGRQTTCTLPFFPFTTRGSSMNNPACRENYLSAALAMMEAYPSDKDPTASWTPSHWNNLFRALELNKGRELLMHIFKARWDVVSKKLSPEQRQTLLDIYLDFLPRVNPSMALKQIEVLEKNARDTHDAGMFRIQRAEIYLYYMGDPETAKKLLTSLAPQGSVDDVSDWARIRYGDACFMSTNLDEATRLYGEVQNRVKKGRGSTAPAATGLTAAQKLLATGGGFAGSAADLKARQEAAAAARAAAAKPSDAPVAQWKMNALLDAACAETVKSLITQGYMLEAKQALREWERHFPLSKISGDYVIQEARFYMAVEDWSRAAAMLDAYCEQVDASSFLPAAVRALLECKEKTKVPEADLVKFGEKMKKKLEFHPVGQEIDDMLEDIKRINRLTTKQKD